MNYNIYSHLVSLFMRRKTYIVTPVATVHFKFDRFLTVNSDKIYHRISRYV